MFKEYTGTMKQGYQRSSHMYEQHVSLPWVYLPVGRKREHTQVSPPREWKQDIPLNNEPNPRQRSSSKHSLAGGAQAASADARLRAWRTYQTRQSRGCGDTAPGIQSLASSRGTTVHPSTSISRCLRVGCVRDLAPLAQNPCSSNRLIVI